MASIAIEGLGKRKKCFFDLKKHAKKEGTRCPVFT